MQLSFSKPIQSDRICEGNEIGHKKMVAHDWIILLLDPLKLSYSEFEMSPGSMIEQRSKANVVAQLRDISFDLTEPLKKIVQNGLQTNRTVFDV